MLIALYTYYFLQFKISDAFFLDPIFVLFLDFHKGQRWISYKNIKKSARFR